MPNEQGPKPPECGLRVRAQAPHPAPLQGSSREASPPNHRRAGCLLFILCWDFCQYQISIRPYVGYLERRHSANMLLRHWRPYEGAVMPEYRIFELDDKGR